MEDKGSQCSVSWSTPQDPAAEYARWNVRVNSIHPGYIEPAMSDYASATTKLSIEELGRMYPLGRMGKPIELARTAHHGDPIKHHENQAIYHCESRAWTTWTTYFTHFLE